MEHLCSEAGKLKHLIISDHIKLFRIFHNPRICRKHTIHIGINLAAVRMESCRQRHRRRIGSAASKSRDVIILIDSLESCYNHDLPLVQLMLDPFGVYSFEPGISITRGRMHHHLERIE